MAKKNSNYLIFVDESGDHHLNKYPKDFPMFVLAFVIITKDEYCDHLLPRFSRLKLKYFPDVSTIFHEREIRKAEKRFSFPTNSEMRNSFYTDLNARPIGIHVLRPEQPNRAWEIIKEKIIQEGLVVLPKK